LSEISDRIRELTEIVNRIERSGEMGEKKSFSADFINFINISQTVYKGLTELRDKTDFNKQREFFNQYSSIKAHIEEFVRLYKKLVNEQEHVVKIKIILKQLDIISNYNFTIDEMELRSIVDNLISQFDIIWRAVESQLLSSTKQ